MNSGVDAVLKGRAPAALFVALVALAMYLNVTGQRTDYGTGQGRFVDQADSYSEYIIRNSVMNDLLGVENRHGSLVMTRGYPQADYTYYVDGTRKYYSHQGLQRRVYAGLAAAFDVDTRKGFDTLFAALRAVNCALLAVTIYAALRAVFRSPLTAYGGTIALALSGGVALFASNLYFMYWLMFAPFFSMVLLKRFGPWTYLVAALICSFGYFACRYEFATTFALLWLLPPLLVGGGPPAGRMGQLRLAGAAFGLVVTGFLVAVATHLAAVARELGISPWEAKELVFATVAARTTSLQGVPAPLSTGFFRWILARQDWAGLAIPLVVVLKKLPIVLAWLALGGRELKKDARSVYALLFLVSVSAYLSWYVAAYQHIMWHGQYDSLLFSVALFMPLVIFVGLKVEALVGVHNPRSGLR